MKLFFTLFALIACIGYSNAHANSNRNRMMGKVVIGIENPSFAMPFSISDWKNVTLIHSIDDSWFIFADAYISHILKKDIWSKPLEIEVQIRITQEKFTLLYTNSPLGYFLLSCPVDDERLEITSDENSIRCNFKESIPATSNSYGGTYFFIGGTSFIVGRL